MIAQSLDLLESAFAGVTTLWTNCFVEVGAYTIVVALVVGAMIWRLFIMPLMGARAGSDKARKKGKGDGN